MLMAGNNIFCLDTARPNEIEKLITSIDDGDLLQKVIDSNHYLYYIMLPVSYTHLDVYKRQIMNNGGIAKRLVNFAQLFVGKIPGSMAQANFLGNMLFGALSGSSVAVSYTHLGAGVQYAGAVGELVAAVLHTQVGQIPVYTFQRVLFEHAGHCLLYTSRCV